MDSQKIEQLKATGDLPSPKGVALAIIRLTQKDDVTSSELEHAIKSDPAFVGRLLKTANMVGRNGGRPVASVQDALVVLGIAVVRNLALSFSLVSNYRSGTCQSFDYKRYWSRSLLFGLALQEVVRIAALANAEEAFCCGLLADVGKLALATLYPKEYAALLSDLAVAGKGNDEMALRQAESDAFAIHNGELASAMLVDWGLPKVFVEPISWRYSQGSAFAANSRSANIVGALQLAELIADTCLLREGERKERVEALCELGRSLDFDRETMLGICDRVGRGWVEWGGMLDVDAEPLKSFAELDQEADSLADEVEDRFLGNLLSPLRVLVADQNADERKILRNLLEEAGHQVFEVADGDKALETTLNIHPHMIIADSVLPGMDGLCLSKALRQTRVGRGIYILILTADDGEDQVVAAFDAGVDDFVSKPLRTRILGARLKAGQRMVQMQQEIERDREEIRSFAAELALNNRRLQEVALTDALTGFHNRRYAMERLDKEWAISIRSGRPISCMMIDIDNFKQVNDTQGHDVGDLMLSEVARALKASLRVNDVICRLGGDEFLVISPDTDQVAVHICAMRLLAAVGALNIRVSGTRLAATVSIGIATRTSAMSDVAMLVKSADAGMYRAKMAGRNQVSA